MPAHGMNIAADSLGATQASTNPTAGAGSILIADGNEYRYIYNASETTTISQYYLAYLSGITTNSAHAVATDGISANLVWGNAMTDIDPLEWGYVCKAGLGVVYATESITANDVGLALAPSGAGAVAIDTGTNAANNFAGIKDQYCRAISTRTDAGTVVANIMGAIG